MSEEQANAIIELLQKIEENTRDKGGVLVAGCGDDNELLRIIEREVFEG